MNFSSFALLAQAQDDVPAALPAAFGAVILLVELAILVVVLAGIWKCFVKAGKPGWAAIIPIYNIIVMLEIAGKPIWWVLLFFIPCVNIVFPC